MRPTYAEVDLGAIRANVRALRRAAGAGVAVMAVVKADGYGHGAIRVSRTALEAGAACLGVAIPEEGAALREAGLAAPIFVLGLSTPDQLPLIVEHGLVATIATLDGARALSAVARTAGTRARVVLKVDTGMGRIGVPPADAPALVAALGELPGIELQGLFTHFAHADAEDLTHARAQLSAFGTLLDALAVHLRWISAANSAALLTLPGARFNLVRPGVALYGLPPAKRLGLAVPLRPAMQLKTRIVFLKRLPAGATVSYGCTYTAPRDTWIATLPVGYADGYSRRLSDGAPVLIGGRRHPLAGRICMDQVMVDLGPETQARVGDEAVLFGRQGGDEVTVTELAARAGTINYELVCAVSPRVPRVYVDEPPAGASAGCGAGLADGGDDG